MLSPFMTVAVLVVLWLIVVVPMIFRRSDERRRDRAVDDFGRAMRALGRRPGRLDGGSAPAGPDVFVPRVARAARGDVAASVPATRRPVPAAQEALMYPPDRSELSAARAHMLARRRRSLGVLIGGSIVFTLLALVKGGALWLLAVPFLLGLVGYLWFLRSQALRDRSRRENRQARAASRAPAGYDATAEDLEFDDAPDSMVRIDDDDIELHSMDTIDLTGLYHEDSSRLAAPVAAQRRAS